MTFPRRSGILLHVTSLPGAHGIGDLGDAAYNFVDFLAESGQKIWQVLPLSPTGYGDSPYQCFSAFAGNPLFIDLIALREQGLLSVQDLTNVLALPEDQVEYARVIDFKQALLHRAAGAFFANRTHKDHDAFNSFCQTNRDWLDDYALFMACKRVHKDVAWVYWDSEIRDRDPKALQQWQDKLSSETQFHKFAQFEFFQQWEKLRAHCSRHGVSIMGDIPIYVAHDSADVWAHRELFRLDEKGHPTAVAGVPPDYFSATGQLWGNPLYRWDVSSQFRPPLVDRSRSCFSQAIRPCALGSLPRFRGVLGNPSQCLDGGGRTLGQGSRSTVISGSARCLKRVALRR